MACTFVNWLSSRRSCEHPARSPHSSGKLKAGVCALGVQMPGIEDVLVQAVEALAAAPANVAVILDAGALEPLLEALAGPPAGRAAAAAHAVGQLAREDDARLSSLSIAPLQVPLS